MRLTILAIAVLATPSALAQTVTSVYNRDTHEPFHLKNVEVESTVVGPLVKTSTLLTYDNPFKSLTEATLNFDMPEMAALGGFAYFYGDEYVRGQLMDKAKAWFIYTAITSRNRDPGIMEQWSPTDYHCQIFPIKNGADLRVRLWTVGMVEPKDGSWTVPKPQVPMAESFYQPGTVVLAKPIWTVHSAGAAPVKPVGDDYVVDLPGQVQAVAQRFKDGRVYVAGVMKLRSHVAQTVTVTGAFYEPANGQPGGADVTEKVRAEVLDGKVAIRANNATFGDPTPGIVKRLRVEYASNDGVHRTMSVGENDLLHLVSNEAAPAVFPKLKQAKTVVIDPQTVAFCGWTNANKNLYAKVGLNTVAFRPQRIASGSDTARLWAQQMLAQGDWKHSRDVLAFSLKYGVPSNATALLAVPKEEWARYEAKAKEFEKQQAEARRRQLEAARQGRAWAGNRNQNWSNSGGGDPEIRVQIPGAVRAEATLPDGRVIDLKRDGDTWGGNFEIPADAREGTYAVRAIGTMPDGSKVEKSWTYNVDRTPPTGTAKLLFENGGWVLEVRCQKPLAEVAAYGPDGTKWTLKAVSPGVYRIELPRRPDLKLTIVLKDLAGNKGTLTCSLPA